MQCDARVSLFLTLFPKAAARSLLFAERVKHFTERSEGHPGVTELEIGSSVICDFRHNKVSLF